MRKVILFNMATLDGFFAGPNGEIDWHHVDEEFNEFAMAQLNAADGLLFGRVTYQGMASYWPTNMARMNDPIVADKMNTLPKIVFSRTLERVEWNNTRLVKGNIPGEPLTSPELGADIPLGHRVLSSPIPSRRSGPRKDRRSPLSPMELKAPFVRQREPRGTKMSSYALPASCSNVSTRA
jgi:hypothetical protein